MARSKEDKKARRREKRKARKQAKRLDSKAQYQADVAYLDDIEREVRELIASGEWATLSRAEQKEYQDEIVALRAAKDAGPGKEEKRGPERDTTPPGTTQQQGKDKKPKDERKVRLGGFKFDDLVSGTLSSENLQHLSEVLGAIAGGTALRGKGINLPDLRRIYKSSILSRGNQQWLGQVLQALEAAKAAGGPAGAAESPMLADDVRAILGEESSKKIQGILRRVGPEVLRTVFSGNRVNLPDMRRLVEALIQSGQWETLNGNQQMLLAGAVSTLEAARPAPVAPQVVGQEPAPPLGFPLPETTNPRGPTGPTPPPSVQLPPGVEPVDPVPPPGGGGGGPALAAYNPLEPWTEESGQFVLRNNRRFGEFGASAPTYEEALARIREENDIGSIIAGQVNPPPPPDNGNNNVNALNYPQAVSGLRMQTPQQRGQGLGALFLGIGQQQGAQQQAPRVSGQSFLPANQANAALRAATMPPVSALNAARTPGSFFLPVGYGFRT